MSAPLTPLARGFREKNARSITGEEELLGLTRQRGVVRRSDIEQRASISESYVGYKLVAEGDLVINKLQAWNGVLGPSAYDGMTSPDYTVLEPNGLWDVGFVSRILRTPAYIVEMAKRSKGIGSGFMRLYTPDLLSIKVPLPSMDVQLQMAGRLDAQTSRIDSLIDRKKRFIELLLEKRTALITHAVTKGLDPDVEMKDSGIEWLGKTPATWELKPLKQVVAACQNGCWGDEPGSAELDAYCVRAADFDRHRMMADPTKLPLRGLTNRELIKNRLRPGNLVIEKSGGGDDQPVGKVVHFGLGDLDAVCSNFQAKVVLAEGVHPWWATYLFEALYTSGVNRRYIKQTTGLQNLDVGDYLVESVPVPSYDTQRQIAEYVTDTAGTIDLVIDKTRKSIELLKEYRTALISAAVTGQIEIPVADSGEDVA